MKIRKISIQGFRSFKDMTEIDVGDFTTIIGKNDAGKSTILHALDIFFNGSPDDGDFNRDQEADAPIIIQVSFSNLPDLIQLEEGVDTDLRIENLVDAGLNLTIRRTYTKKNPKKPKITYIVQDFQDVEYQNLCSLKESELNEKGKSLGLDFKKAGARITNKSKREAIRKIALEKSVAKKLIEIEANEVSETALDYLPDFSLFRADQPLSEEGTAFQNEFKKVVETAVDKIQGKADIQTGIEKAINDEVQKIHSFLLKHTDEVASIKANPFFEWKKIVTFSLECRDKQGKDIALSKRGSGLRRLLMVAYFQYLAQRGKTSESIKGNIYGIEEPETYLHPGAQRDLLSSFKEIAISEQVLVSSHSPVFAGSTDIRNLILIVREDGVAKAEQRDKLDFEKVANELGVEPTDQIRGYNAIVFVDGPQDCDVFATIVKTFKDSNKLTSTFENKQIGILVGGGNNLKHWITRQVIKKINRKFAVILDSDRKSESEAIDPEKLRLKSEVEKDNGICFILQKREIENYLHKDIIKRHKNMDIEVKDFIDMKKLCGRQVSSLFKHMNLEQIMERDEYRENGVEKHELLEICEQILNLVP